MAREHYQKHIAPTHQQRQSTLPIPYTSNFPKASLLGKTSNSFDGSSCASSANISRKTNSIASNTKLELAIQRNCSNVLKQQKKIDQLETMVALITHHYIHIVFVKCDAYF